MKLIAILVGMCLASVALAVVPAATELTIISTATTSITPAEVKHITWSITKSDDPSPFGAAASSLAGCSLSGNVQMEGGQARLFMRDAGATLLCVRSGKTETHSGGEIKGQLVDQDGKNGIRLECKGKPDCLVGTLKTGVKAKFLLTQPIK